jgi:Tol biopolymer transport system component
MKWCGGDKMLRHLLLKSGGVIFCVCVLCLVAAQQIGAWLHGDVLSYTVGYQRLVLRDWTTGVRTYERLPFDGSFNTPTWSNDGRLAFSSNNAQGYYEVYVWDGVQLAALPSPERSNSFQPAWRADGALSFTSDRGGENDLYVWDGQTLYDLITGPSRDSQSAWAADGRFAFTSFQDGNADIYTWDGAQYLNVSQSTAWDATAAWAADGRLAFVSGRDGNLEVYVWDGTRLHNLTQSAVADYDPSWSPRGRLAFIREDVLATDVYVWDQGTIQRLGPTTAVGEAATAWWP